MIKKLVRDNIPNIIESSGRIPIYECVEDREEYIQLLKCKLQEEVTEFFESNEVVELCDVVEVVYVLIKVNGMSLEEFEKLRIEKASINGSFEKRFYLNNIID
ncbi:MAG: nucleoside triphosphate pyrophosphohydrolase [Oscillospiraceae bacterium]|nr:nucleoside triphosphate pyrophosphohydrolase [Oscillospiraceae bacterium]